MKKIILSILVVLTITKVSGQTVKDYFIPEFPYNKTNFYIPSKTNERTGLTKTIYYENEGNNRYVILSVNRSEGELVAVEEITVKFISNEVRKTNSFVESILQPPEKEIYSNPKLIFILPPEGGEVNWSDERGKCTASWEVVSIDGAQKKAIKVIIDSEAITIKTVEYYVQGIGLWKTEHLSSDGTAQVFFEFDGLYHDSTIKDKAKEEFILENKLALDNKKRIEEEKKQVELYKFLQERKTKAYNYETVNSDGFNDIEYNLKQLMANITPTTINDNEIDFSVNFMIDTLSVTTVRVEFSNNDYSSINEKINESLNKIKLKPAYTKQYTVNATAKFNCKNVFHSYSIEKTDDGFLGDVIYESSNDSFLKDIKTYLSSKNHPNGFYKIQQRITKINCKIFKDIKILDYKASGSVSSALLSLLVPGLGDYSVNGGNGSMFGEKIPPLVTTVSALGAIGAGIFMAMESSKNYDLYKNYVVYKNSTDESREDYYNLANSQNKISSILLVAGAGLWLYDIYWVMAQGINNTRIEKIVKRDLQISVLPNTNNSINIYLTYRF